MAFITGVYLIILLALSFLDSLLTYEWAVYCSKHFPKAKLNQIESNKLVTICWNNYGILKGSVASGVLLFIIQFLLSSIHIYVYYVVMVILVWAIYNHINNFIKSNRTIEERKKKEGKNE